MKMIYVASPYAGDIETNVEFAVAACDFVLRCGNGFIAPHLFYPKILDDSDPKQRKQGLEMGLTLLERSDALWFFGDHVSAGMRVEIEYASQKNIPIRQITKDEVEMPEFQRQQQLLRPTLSPVEKMARC